MKVPIQIRVEKDDLVAWQGAATQAGVTLSEWIRCQCSGNVLPGVDPNDFSKRARLNPIIEHHTDHHARCPCSVCVYNRSQTEP